eukprot:3846137-Rhodomonas_salina.1
MLVHQISQGLLSAEIYAQEMTKFRLQMTKFRLQRIWKLARRSHGPNLRATCPPSQRGALLSLRT